MLTEKPAPTEAQIAKAAALREEAERARVRREESFQRSDTDGFLSQWANGITSDLNERQAKLLDDGEHARFPVLVYDGQVVADRIFKFANPGGSWLSPNKRWRLPQDLADKLGRKWIPVGAASRIQKQLGLHEEDRWFPAYAKITTGGGRSTGLAGAANAYVGVFKEGEGDD